MSRDPELKSYKQILIEESGRMIDLLEKQNNEQAATITRYQTTLRRVQHVVDCAPSMSDDELFSALVESIEHCPMDPIDEFSRLKTRTEKTEATLEGVRALIPEDQQSRLVERIRAVLGPAPAPKVTGGTSDFVEYECPDCSPTDGSVKCARHKRFASPAPAPAAEPTGWEYRARHFEARVAELEATLEGVRAYERCEAWDADGCQMSLGEILAGHTPAPAQAAVSSLEEYADLTGSPMADSKATAQACQVPTEGWVFFDNLEEQAIDDHIQLNAALRRAEELSSALQSELKKSRDRLVEHKQMNRSLNEVVQATQARVDKAVKILEPMDHAGSFVVRALEVLSGE